MIQMLTHASRWARVRAPLLVLAVLAGACDSDDNLATTETTVPVEGVTLDSAAADSLASTDSLPTDSTEVPAPDTIPEADTLGLFEPVEPSFDHARYRGIPYGAIGLWASSKSVRWGPAPFTGTQNYTDARGIITQINAARARNHRLVLAMTGGPSTRYTTRGKFDMGKWTRRMNTFNTSAIRRAVTAAVADGTIIANQLIDEPETKRWGGNISKRTIDQMARYAKRIFPTLPMGINVGPPGHMWRSSERFQSLDYVVYQYNHYITSGNVAKWRDQALAQARRDGVTPAFSLNILDGGVQDRKRGNCSGSGQAGRGTYYPNCRMTPTQVREWGRALAGAGCTLQMWRFDARYMASSANQGAFRDLASVLSSRAPRSCRRPGSRG